MNKELIERALSQYGVREIPGEDDNPMVVNYFKDIGHGGIRDDETAWCSAFMNWVCYKEEYESSGKLNARSWLTVGDPVTSPQIGDVVVFWRSDSKSWKGHVGLYISTTGPYIQTLGGNQSNMVCIKPYSKNRVLEYRRPIKIKLHSAGAIQ